MQTTGTWALPVAASLLLHAALLALVAYRLSASSPDTRQAQTLSVELAGATPTRASPPRPQEPTPAATKKTAREPLTTAAQTALTPPAAQTLPTTATPAQSSSNNPSAQAPPESGQTGLNIQPLSKLTRPPAFLRKIEPVYPSSEQRAGSQAYVLAEVTIDEQGKVLDVKILTSAGSAFDDAVMQALLNSVFVPGYIGGDAVAVRVLVPFRFNLR